MAKHLKITIKNTQIAEAINLGGLKEKLAKKKEADAPTEKKPTSKPSVSKSKKEEIDLSVKPTVEESPRVRARSKSVFAESPGSKPQHAPSEAVEAEQSISTEEEVLDLPVETEEPKHKKHNGRKSSEELRREIFGDEALEENNKEAPTISFEDVEESVEVTPVTETAPEPEIAVKAPEVVAPAPTPKPAPVSTPTPRVEERRPSQPPRRQEQRAPIPNISFKPPTPYRPDPNNPIVAREKLGPTGRHISDLLPPPPPPRKEEARVSERSTPRESRPSQTSRAPAAADDSDKQKAKVKPREPGSSPNEASDALKKGGTKAPVKEFRDIKPARKTDGQRSFDVRDRQGLRDSDEDQRWRKKRHKQARHYQEDLTIRPTSLKIRTPISIKDLASEMKLKSSELISKLFLQGLVVTLNDTLEDDTTIQLLGHEFGCEITIDTSEEKRIRITDKTVREEILETAPELLTIRAPIVAFMGHVDHGKTSLIDAIRKSNRAAGEAGAITQHIGAFRCSTAVGDITILDTPGHEAFSAMRARGAVVTDIVVLVVAGDEGIRQQTLEAIEHARTANVTIVVAINKADKPGFNPENVYRQLADNNLLPEVWGGQTLTVNCSASTGAGVKELLEMLALQSEVMELKASPAARARGMVLESEMHKGMGSVATVLVQNGTLKLGDSLVFEQFWGHVKTMHNEFGKNLTEAPPSTPVEITGLSGLPEAGQEFIVVKSEREAREISAARTQGFKQSSIQHKKTLTLENVVQQATPTTKKVLNVILRADVQGSLEALRVALQKIQSTKAELNVVFAGVGEVSESDIQLAYSSKALVLGFHTRVENHAEPLVKSLKVQVKLHDIIYHAVDDVKAIMTSLLDKIAQETDRGKAIVKAIFKSSQVGLIAGCQVTEGTIQRNNTIRVIRDGKVLGKASIASLKRVKEDVKEVTKGLECGIALTKFPDLQVDDILESYEITYLTQEL